jgi:hypothetical protein
MGTDKQIWIEWVRCAEHYNPAKDDPIILEASKNKRVYLAEIKKLEDERFGTA